MMSTGKPGGTGNGGRAKEAGAKEARESASPVRRAGAQSYGGNVGRLLDRNVPFDYLHEWTERVAAEINHIEIGTRSVVVFHLGDEWLALPTGSIHEVAEGLTVHTVPHRRNGVLRGLVSFRGELWLCVSLRAVLGIEVGRESEDHRIFNRVILAGQGANRLAFPVDDVLGVRRFHPDELEEPPATLAGATARYTEGLLMTENKAVGCLDQELLFYSINKSLS